MKRGCMAGPLLVALGALDRQVVGAASGEADAALWVFGAARREWFEGEHPLVSWSPGRDGEIPDAGYAPSEYRLKPWPNEARSGAWCPRVAGNHNKGFEVERVAGRTSHAVASRASTPSVLTRGLTHRRPSAIVR